MIPRPKSASSIVFGGPAKVSMPRLKLYRPTGKQLYGKGNFQSEDDEANKTLCDNLIL